MKPPAKRRAVSNSRTTVLCSRTARGRVRKGSFRAWRMFGTTSPWPWREFHHVIGGVTAPAKHRARRVDRRSCSTAWTCRHRECFTKTCVVSATVSTLLPLRRISCSCVRNGTQQAYDEDSFVATNQERTRKYVYVPLQTTVANAVVHADSTQSRALTCLLVLVTPSSQFPPQRRCARNGGPRGGTARPSDGSCHIPTPTVPDRKRSRTREIPQRRR